MSESITLKKALFAIKKLKKLLHEQQEKSFQPIAIIGLSCRFPEAMNKDEYWELLCQGKNIISSIPDERWELLNGTQEATLKNTTQHCRGGFLKNIAAFDPHFFGMTPREAIRMDPQQRLLLEVAYEAFEDAGLSTEVLAGSDTGVFTSLYASQFAHLQTLENDMDALYIPTGNAVSIAANRLSYLFDLKGPSVVFDTACSSSLVSLHLACLNLQAKLCKLALVSAVSINLLPSIHLLLSKAKMLSPDGQCKTFDASANGYVQGEGVGAILLKPLVNALEDKDRIYGVIAGAAVNQDGKTNGLTAPNGLQQEALLKSAYQTAHVETQQVSYVECHGTGTFLGDPIEAEALGKIMSQKRDAAHPCWIASVKTNIGHLEPAAGMASIIKVALALQSAKIPPHLNFNMPNPHIDFEKYHFRIPQRVEEWPKYGEYRIAGISGFGFGGTNAHIVLRELSDEEKQMLSCSENSPMEELFTLSAKDPLSLQQLMNRWLTFIENNTTLNLSQICYNLHVRRSHYSHRIAIIAHTLADLAEQLQQICHAALDNKNLKDKLKISSELSQNTLAHMAIKYINHEDIDWHQFERNRIYPHVDMPLYVWQNKNYWPNLATAEPHKTEEITYPFAKKLIASPLTVKQFEFQFNTAIMPEISDTYHFLHAGYYVEMLAIAIDQLHGQNTFTLTDCTFKSPIFVPDNASRQVMLILEEFKNNSQYFTFYSHAKDSEWIQHMTGYLSLDVALGARMDTLDNIKKRCSVTGTAEKFFSHISAMNMPSGDSIRWTKTYAKNDKEILCELTTPSSAAQSHKFKLNIHLGVIDGCIQAPFLLLPDDMLNPHIASHIRKFTYFGHTDKPLYLHATLESIQPKDEKYLSNFYLMDSDSHVVAECQGLCMTRLSLKVQTNTIGKQEIIDVSSLSPQVATQKIIQYLTEQIAIIFAMPIPEINIDKSLSDMGIDSLMSIALVSAIQAGLGITYPMQSLLTGATIADIAEFVLDHHQTLSIASTASWIMYRKPQLQSKIRLFCFPYGGGGASIYREWQDHLPNWIEVCPIQLPGRENRMDEPPIQNIETLIDAFIENLKPEFNIPFIFFGHSFGALVSFELSRVLRKRRLPQPLHLFVSAFPDPIIPTKSLDNMMSELKNADINLFDLSNADHLSSLTTDKLDQIAAIFIQHGLTEFNARIMNHEMIKILLPIFISDMILVKNYQYDEDLPLDIPITVFSGNQDTWVNQGDHLGWARHTRIRCHFHKLEGGHLFIKDNAAKKQLLERIAGSIY